MLFKFKYLNLRYLHENFFTGTVPFLVKVPNVKLASNFLVGNVPESSNSSKGTSDFRFNYFNDCKESCCFLNLNCTPQCLSSGGRKGPLPLGVEASVWTELNVTLLGTKKRIIQIETRFISSPHFLRSYACPNTSSLVGCNNTRVLTPLNDTFGVIPLETNVTFSSSQAPNTYKKFVYLIQGGVCTTNVKVIILSS
jgi:hypothetical protein